VSSDSRPTPHVRAVGEGVSNDLPGTHAALIPLMPCFHCEECQRGYYSVCHSYSFIDSRRNGGFAEYVEIPERNALILPDDLSFEAAALSEPSHFALSAAPDVYSPIAAHQSAHQKIILYPEVP